MALDVVELVASIKQANTPPVEYMTDTLLEGMIGVPYTPAGQTLGLSGTPTFVAPQYVELTHHMVAAARHIPAVRKQLPVIVKNYTIIPKEQLR